MASVEIDKFGIKRYFNEARHLHREDGPAIIRPDGGKYYYLNDMCGCHNRPNIGGNGGAYWFEKSSRLRKERIDGPAWDWPNGYKKWSIAGEQVWPKL